MSSMVGSTSEEMVSCHSIDRKFLPFKIHYFLLCGAHVGVIPFLPVFAKSRLGLSATTVGVLSTGMQLSNALSKPAFGMLADYTNKMRAVMISLICAEMLLILFILGIPSTTTLDGNSFVNHSLNSSQKLRSNHTLCETGSYIEQNVRQVWNTENKFQLDGSKHAHFTIGSQNTSKSSALKNSLHDTSCTHAMNYVNCNFSCQSKAFWAKCFSNFTSCVDLKTLYNIRCRSMARPKRNISHFKSYIDSRNYFNVSFEFKRHLMRDSKKNEIKIFPVSVMSTKRFPALLRSNLKSSRCSLHCSYNVQLCLNSKRIPDYESPQFLMFAVCSILSVMCQGAIFSLSDTICYENLRSSLSNYGHQRFFGAIGWGSMALLTGYLNSLADDDPSRSYTSGLYLMLVLSAFLILNTHNIDMKLPVRKFLVQNSGNIYTSKEFIFVELCVLAAGSLTAYTSCYMIWYIESLGGTQLLGGLALAIQCLLGESLFIYFSDTLISKLGHMNIMSLTFLVFSVRYYGYYLLKNPWMVLPLEVLHGVTYGLFYSTITSFAKEIAPAGSEATVQGIFGGTFLGLGTGLGSFMAGVSIDMFGGRVSFLMAAIFSTFAALASCIASFLIKSNKSIIVEMI